MNKKTNVLQLFFVLGTIVAFIFVGIFGLKILNSFGAAFTSVGDVEGIANLEAGIGSFSLIDNLIPFVTIILFIIFIVSAFYIQTNPAFFFISLFLLTIVVIGSTTFSNVVGVLGQVPSLVNETAVFSKSLTLAESFPLYASIAGFLFLLVMYGLWRNGQ
jgi:hypothetical protein